MTVSELIEALKDMPQDAEVRVNQAWGNDYGPEVCSTVELWTTVQTRKEKDYVEIS